MKTRYGFIYVDKDNDGNGDGTTDTTFFTSFNPVEAGCVDENDPLFTFTFPDGTTVPLGYLFAIGLMILFSAGTIWFFRYKKWL